MKEPFDCRLHGYGCPTPMRCRSEAAEHAALEARYRRRQAEYKRGERDTRPMPPPYTKE